jgi:hypothetical protein
VRRFCTFEFKEREIPAGLPRKRELNAVEFARERLGFEADERQAEVLLSEVAGGF